MNKYGKRSLLFLFASAAMMQSQADSTITFSGFNVKAGQAHVILPQATVTGTGEGTIRFDLKGHYTGFCQLDLGEIKKMIFVEDGDDLRITCDAGRQGNGRFQFAGRGASANTYLATHERAYVRLPQSLPEGAALRRLMTDSLDGAARRVGQLSGLSEAFRRWEGLRQQYGMLRAFFGKTGWKQVSQDEILIHLKVWPELWSTTEYKAFFLDALYAVGIRNGGEDIHGYTLAELKYVQAHIQEPYMADELLKHVMTMYMEQRGADDSADLMEVFLSTVTDARNRDEITRQHAAWKKVERGQRLPEFTFTDLRGQQVKLSDFIGRYVFIDCWATWCGPCKIQIPHLKKLEERYHGRNIVFVSLSSDKDRNAWAKMVQDQKLGGVQLNEPRLDCEFFTLFQVSAIPRFILLSPDGTVYDAHMPRPSNEATTALLDKLL